jgi:hypothetical protein
MIQLYAMRDNKKEDCMTPVTPERAAALNRVGYGIFFTPNAITGRRIEENVTEIKYWFADMDDKTKPEQMQKIDKLLYKPSRIVESKRGYHLYWRAVDATKENFRKIMLGIIEKLGSDKAVQGANRTMRMPGFYHMKDPKEPFLVRVIFKSNDVFTEKEMLYGFRQKDKKVQFTSYQKPPEQSRDEMLKPENWDRIFNLSRIGNGCRNNEFTRIVLWLRDIGFDAPTVRWSIHEMNKRISEPLPETEINLILKGKV